MRASTLVSSSTSGYDDPDDDAQRWTTWYDVDPLCRGPEPRPDWVVTSRAAVDTELGVLKTGKEADVLPAGAGRPARPRRRGVVMAAKRYRSERAPRVPPGGQLHRRSPGPQQPDTRAMAKKSAFGRSVAAGQWAWSEWQALVRCQSSACRSPTPSSSTRPSC